MKTIDDEILVRFIDHAVTARVVFRDNYDENVEHWIRIFKAAKAKLKPNKSLFENLPSVAKLAKKEEETLACVSACYDVMMEGDEEAISAVKEMAAQKLKELEDENILA